MSTGRVPASSEHWFFDRLVVDVPDPTLVLLVFRALLPWVLVALVAWWIWKAISK